MQQLEQLEKQVGALVDKIQRFKDERDHARLETRSLKERIDELELQCLQYEEDLEKRTREYKDQADRYQAEKDQLLVRIDSITETIKGVLVQHDADSSL